jgi:hypothetical protein
MQNLDDRQDSSQQAASQDTLKQDFALETKQANWFTRTFSMDGDKNQMLERIIIQGNLIAVKTQGGKLYELDRDTVIPEYWESKLWDRTLYLFTPDKPVVTIREITGAYPHGAQDFDNLLAVLNPTRVTFKEACKHLYTKGTYILELPEPGRIGKILTYWWFTKRFFLKKFVADSNGVTVVKWNGDTTYHKWGEFTAGINKGRFGERAMFIKTSDNRTIRFGESAYSLPSRDCSILIGILDAKESRFSQVTGLLGKIFGFHSNALMSDIVEVTREAQDNIDDSNEKEANWRGWFAGIFGKVVGHGTDILGGNKQEPKWVDWAGNLAEVVKEDGADMVGKARAKVEETRAAREAWVSKITGFIAAIFGVFRKHGTNLLNDVRDEVAKVQDKTLDKPADTAADTKNEGE